MSKSLTNLLTHIIFSTKSRKELLYDDICKELFPYFATILKNNNCSYSKIGGTLNHVHILCSLPRTISIGSLVEELKTSTSKWIKKHFELEYFYWQTGYGAFSISPSHKKIVEKYIENQKEHHKKVTYEDEIRKLIAKYNIICEEKYLFD